MRDCLGRLLPASALCLVLFASPVFSQGALKPISINPNLALVEREVQLEVFINSETTGLIVAFKFTPTGNVLRAQRGELRKAGIKVPGSGSEIVPYLAPHESRRLFGAAEGAVHSHSHSHSHHDE